MRFLRKYALNVIDEASLWDLSLLLRRYHSECFGAFATAFLGSSCFAIVDLLEMRAYQNSCCSLSL